MPENDKNQKAEAKQQLPPHQAAVLRNVWLQQHWFTRVMAPVVVGGATMQEPDYRRTTLFFVAVVFLLAVFGGNALLEDYALHDAVFVVALCALLVVSVPVMIAARIGYRNRDRIDTEGVPPMAMARTMKITLLCSLAAPWVLSWIAQLFE